MNNPAGPMIRAKSFSTVESEELDTSAALSTVTPVVESEELDTSAVLRTVTPVVESEELDTSAALSTVTPVVESEELDTSAALSTVTPVVESEELDTSAVLRTATPVVESEGLDPSAVLSTVTPIVPPAKKQLNYAFLMAVMAHPSTQIVAAVLFTASLLFLGFLATGLAQMTFTAGAMLAGLGMFAGGTSLFSGNRWAAAKKLEDEPEEVIATSMPTPGSSSAVSPVAS